MNPYIGKTLGSYQILEQIGQGGMATIFKAYQPSMDRYVAVKILPSHFTNDETFVARFTQEARTLASLEHPHILPVHDYGEQEGITYLVMRYVDAGTLKDLIVQRGPLDLTETARILGQLCRALGYAHSQGIIHRDIKPTNVLIDRRGDAFLTDFGIAKLVAGTAQFTATGAVVGTPAYMAPEQGMGHPLDGRCDIYALGVMLYEMVTGQVPFDAETPLAILMQHVNASLPLPRHITPDLPDAVERVILKALAKLPADRFQTAEEMGDTLHKAVAGLPTEIDLPIQPVDGPTAVIQQPAFVEAPPSYKPTETAEPIAATKVVPPPDEEKPVVAPTRKRIPWLPIAGGLALLAVLIVAALLILPNLDGNEMEEPPLATSPLPAGWTNYSNANFVQTVARQGDYVWAGGMGGLVRWDLEDGSYVKLGITDGLASGQINDLLVDDDGNLWVATQAGISRFDGEEWITFDDLDGLDTPWVISLFLDTDGALWAGTAYGERGLNYYTHDGGWGPPPISPMPFDFPRPRTFAQNEDGILFVGLDERGLAYTDGDEWGTLTSDDGLPGDQVYDLLLVDNKTLLVSFGREIVGFDLEADEWDIIPQLSGRETYHIHQANDGSLWFIGEGGATRYDSATGDWERFEPDPDTIPAWAATAIIEDNDGIWLGTDGGGVVLYDGENWENFATDDELGGNQVDQILQDGTGALWFTFPGRGLTRHDPATDAWQTFGNKDGALNWPSVPGLNSEYHLWIGGYGDLRWYDGQSWHRIEPDPLTDVTVYGVTFAPDDVLWLWSDVGVMRHDPVADEWTNFTADDHPVLEGVEHVRVAGDGMVWVGGDYGLVGYDGHDWNAPVVEADGSPIGGEYGDVHGIAESSDSNVWVIADGDLYHLDDARWSRFTWPDDWIDTMTVGPDRTVWVGSDDALGHFYPSSQEWETFTTEDGLIHPGVEAIHVTLDGVVWIGTEGGISRYVPE
ncbi:MAG: protein kinase [Chloroflexi bacterium]|nr:protein kinase [Chloroflexota bacterium]